MDKGEDGFLFETVQSIPFRTCCESLKEVLVDGAFEFSPEGIHLLSIDNTKSIVVQLTLIASNIERYTCTGKYRLGINMAIFYRVIKTVTTADTITLVYKESDPYRLCIQINSIEKRSSNRYTMQLLTIDPDRDIQFDINVFDTVLQMQAQYFQKICKDLLNTGGTNIHISARKDCVVFRSNDTLLESELALYETSEGLRFKKNEICNCDERDEKRDYGTYVLKHLITFTKCTTLCPIVTLYLKRQYPLVLQYNVATLGHIRYCIASLTESEIRT